MTQAELIEIERKKREQQRLAEQEKNKQQAQEQANSINAQYDKQVTEANQSYDDAYRENAVQKEINKRAIANNMAEMGLTDSGLNRTQITANELATANNKGKLDRMRMQEIGNINLARGQGLAGLRNQERQQGINIDRYYEDMATRAGTNAYNAQVDAQNKLDMAKINAQNKLDLEKQKAKTALEKEYIKQTINNTKYGFGANGKPRDKYIISKDNGILSRDFLGKLKDNDVISIRDNNGDWVFKDTRSGKTSRFEAGINPFTGTKNKELFVDGAYDASRAFSNGYQPKYIGDFKLQKVPGENGGFVTVEVSGNEQSVWKAGDNYYIWDGAINDYAMLGDADKAKLNLR